MELSLQKKTFHLFSVRPAALKLGFMHCLESPTLIALYYLCIADKFREGIRTQDRLFVVVLLVGFIVVSPLNAPPPPAQHTR